MTDLYKSIIGWCSEQSAHTLYEYTMKAPIPRVLELGAFCGRSTVVFADAVKERRGTVVSIDRFATNMRYEGTVIPDTRKLFMLKTKPYSEFIVMIQGELSIILPKINGLFGVVYVDADHTIEGLIGAYGRTWDLLCPSGYMIFHDYEHPTYPEVRMFVELLGKRHKTIPIIIDRMAIIQK